MFVKAFAEIAKIASIVQKENTFIDIKIKLNLPSLIPVLIHRVWPRASIISYNKNTQMESIRFSE